MILPTGPSLLVLVPFSDLPFWSFVDLIFFGKFALMLALLPRSLYISFRRGPDFLFSDRLDNDESNVYTPPSIYPMLNIMHGSVCIIIESARIGT